jgi:hypothetical protein
VAKAAAAVQKQVTDHFGPAWDVTATVDAFPSLDDMPHGYWPVVIRDDIGINQPGIHLSDGGQKCFALVLFSGSKWTLTLSHEILDMLADPFGVTFQAGPSVKPGQGSVEYLVEVCDPCQSDDCAYPVNGVLVSDFVTKAYYTGYGSGFYSYARNLTQPRTVKPYSYLTWYNPLSRDWWQLIDTGEGPKTQGITVDVSLANIHLRGIIDRATDPKIQAAKKKRGAGKSARVSADQKRVHELMSKYAQTTAAEAEWWREQIEAVARRAAGESAGGESRSRKARNG